MVIRRDIWEGIKMRELWKKIEDCPMYVVSNCGRVKRITSGLGNKAKAGFILKRFKGTGGYLRVGLGRQGQKPKQLFVHRLVLEAFVGPCPLGLQCNHIDGVRTNSHIENLEWVTSSENHFHTYRVLGYKAPCGEQHWRAELTESQVREIRDLYASGCYTQLGVAKIFNVSRTTVNLVVNYKIWKHVN